MRYLRFAVTGYFLFIHSCAPKPKEAILGRWVGDVNNTGLSKDVPAVIEFHKDGTFIFTSSFVSASGTYQVLDANTIKFFYTPDKESVQTQVEPYSLSGDTLVLPYGDRTVEFKRQK